MNVQEFIEKFAEAIDVESSNLTVETEFRTLDEWDSVAYLSVIAMMDEEYDKRTVRLLGQTVQRERIMP